MRGSEIPKSRGGRKMRGRGWEVGGDGGSGARLQERALAVLGDAARAEYVSLQTSGGLLRFANTHRAALLPDEHRALVRHAFVIGVLFGFQEE